MLESLVKYRSLIMILVSAVMLSISYHFSLRHTVDAYREHQTLLKQLDNGGGQLIEPKYLERKLDNLNRLISIYRTDTSTFRNVVVNTIALIAQRHQVQLTEVPFGTAGSKGDERVLLQRLVLKGEFLPLLEAYQEITRSNDAGFLRSASWKKQRRNSSMPAADKDIILEIYVTGLK